MKPNRFEYHAPLTLQVALELLDENQDDAKVLAGGQSLVPAMNFRLASPSYLIDLNRISELRSIRREDDCSFSAGAMTRHRDFERDASIRSEIPLIPEALSFVAHVQIRNRGTIGGSLAHADPAAEWPALCIALGAVITVANVAGERTLQADEFTQGVYATALMPNEIIVRIGFPVWPSGRRWGFSEVSRRLGDFAMVGAICTLDFDGEHRCTGARLVVFAAGDKPIVLDSLNGMLLGKHVMEEDCALVARAARTEVQTRSDHHASAEYRKQLVQTLVYRALMQATNSDVMQCGEARHEH